jgi:hypothetical protein
MLGVAPVNIRVIDLQVMPSVTPRSLRRLHWVMVPGPIGARCVTVDHLQLDLTSSLLALDTGLSPGAPVNNCRWASTQKTGPTCGPIGLGCDARHALG